MLKNLRVIYLLPMLFVAQNCLAQDAGNAQMLRNKQTATATAYQKASLAELDKIYNGQAYKFYGPPYKGSPFFRGELSWEPGTIVYNNVTYPDMQIMYDTFRDLVVVYHYNKLQQFSLASAQVQSFDLLGHHFVYAWDNAEKPQLTAGFYDELYRGNLQLLAKHEAVAVDSVGGQLAYKIFERRLTYYLKRGTQYNKVRSRGDMVGVLKDRKKELEAYIKSNNLNFNSDKEQSMIKTLAYYEQISK